MEQQEAKARAEAREEAEISKGIQARFGMQGESGCFHVHVAIGSLTLEAACIYREPCTCADCIRMQRHTIRIVCELCEPLSHVALHMVIALIKQSKVHSDSSTGLARLAGTACILCRQP